MAPLRQKIPEVPKGREDLTRALLELRDVTLRLGIVHDLQSTQLRLWPRIAFPHASKCTCTLDPKAHVARFKLTTSGRQPARMAARAAALDKNVKFLLGDWWRVQIDIDGKRVLDSAAKAKVKTKNYEGTDFEAGKIVPQEPWAFNKTNLKN